MDHSKKEGSKTVGQARDQAEPKSTQPSKMGSDQKADQKDLRANQKTGAGAVDQTKHLAGILDVARHARSLRRYQDWLDGDACEPHDRVLRA